MNNEFDEMRLEIDRIAVATKFNSITMLNSASDTISIHFGELATDKIDIATSKMDSASNALNITGLGTSWRIDVGTGQRHASDSIDSSWLALHF